VALALEVVQLALADSDFDFVQLEDVNSLRLSLKLNVKFKL
jgi:hypothetical protein